MLEIEQQLEHLELDQGWQLKPVSGGCIGQSFKAQKPNRSPLFIKHQPQALPDQLQREAEGLAQLSSSGKVQTPEVIAVTDQLLVLEWLAPEPASADAWRELGRQLAQLHRHPAPYFGFEQDNYCGSTLQPNPRTEDGFEFFGEHRLIYQARMAHRRRLLPAALLEQTERLAQRLTELLPEQPAALIHGDLWSGNILFSRGRGQLQPFLIDPAAHFGWAEAELAMTLLFGGFAPEFYQAYQSHNPFEPGWSERVDIYNLYHLLNHLNLFGASYLPQVERIVRRF